MNDKLPNFLIVGAAKSGTTSLYAYLIEHPDVYIPTVKECRFFSQMPANFKGPGDERLNKSIVKNLSEYKSLFSYLNNQRAVGDVSPDYLYFYDKSISKIKQILGTNVKIIIILRDPIARAFSQYSHFFRDKRETLSFEEALKNEDERRKSNWEWAWFYKDVGFYYKQVRAYLGNFSQVKIYLFDDLKNDAMSVIQGIYNFLDVDDSFVPENLRQRFNISGEPKNMWLHEFLNKPNSLKTALKPFIKVIVPKSKRQELKYLITKRNLNRSEIQPETREYLKGVYREDITKLQDLLNRDLSHWLK